jgi:hypothetical protein
VSSPRAEVERARSNERLAEFLTEGENIRLAARSHWIVLLRPFAITTAMSLMSGWLLLRGSLPLSSPLTGVLSLVAVGSWCYFVWAFLTYRHDLFVATERRVLKYEGLFAKSVPMMRVSKITDMHFTQTIPGEILGYGTIIIESAGQEQALREVRYLTHPLENYRRLCEVIFGQGPSSSRRRQRRLPFLPRRVPAGPPPQLGPASQPGPATAYPKPGAPWHSPAAAGPSAPPHPWPREERIYSSSDPSGSNANPTQPIPLDERRTRRRRTPWEFYPEQGD